MLSLWARLTVAELCPFDSLLEETGPPLNLICLHYIPLARYTYCPALMIGTKSNALCVCVCVSACESVRASVHGASEKKWPRAEGGGKTDGGGGAGVVVEWMRHAPLEKKNKKTN